METIIANLANSTGVSFSAELLDKVKETLRRLQNKLPLGSLGKSEKCRMILALEISCRLTGTIFERKQLLKHAAVGENEYQKALTTCKAALDITWNFVNVTEVLAMQYSPELVQDINPILSDYQFMYVDKLPVNVRGYVKLDAPLYICAAFMVAAENKQIKFDKAALCKLSETAAAKLFKLASEMKEIVGNGAATSFQNSSRTIAPQPAPSSRGQRLLQAHLNNSSVSLSAVDAAKDVKMRPLYEVRQNALQDSNKKAQNIQSFTDRARDSYVANTTTAAERNSINIKSGLKRNLSVMQHALVSAGDAENCSKQVSSTNSASAINTSSYTGVSASVTAQLTAEAVAKEKREAYEAWRDSMKKAKLNR